jgi:AcrR family transcriptional regulator
MPAKRLRGEDRRNQILGVALDLFAQRGYAGTPTRLIAQTAGVSEGLLFQHFPVKRDLLLASLELPDVRDLAISLDRIRARANRNGTDVWRSLFRELLGFLRTHASIVRVLYQESALDPVVREAFEREIIGRYRDTVITLMSSNYPEFESAIVARATFGMLLNFVVVEDWLDSPHAPRYPDSLVLDQLTLLVKRGLESPGKISVS